MRVDRCLQIGAVAGIVIAAIARAVAQDHRGARAAAQGLSGVAQPARRSRESDRLLSTSWPGVVPAIHVSEPRHQKTWMPATSAGMTI